MKRASLAAVALAACLLCHSAFAAEPSSFGAAQPAVFLPELGNVDTVMQTCGYSHGGCTSCGSSKPNCGCCQSSSCCSGGWVATFDVDLLVFQYLQSGGVQSSDAGNIIGNNDNVDFDYSLSPRFTLGIEGSSGFGGRMSYWYFDQSSPTIDNLGFLDIDAQTFTLEMFKRVEITRCTVIEGFGGVRYAEFNQSDDTDLDYRFHGLGVTTGLEVSHYIFHNQRLYAGTRLAIIQADNRLFNDGDLDDSTGLGLDHVTSQIELSIGWEGTSHLGGGFNLVYGAGLEFHNWSDAAIKNDSSDEGYLADAGWGGFTFRLGAEY